MVKKQELWQPVQDIQVQLDFGDTRYNVGRLAERDRRIYFEYDGDFIRKGLEISPFKLPLKPGVESFSPDPFEGLPGVFNDSLPDGWGRLLFDRYVRGFGVNPAAVSPLDRLAHVGNKAIGALCYVPDHSPALTGDAINLDRLAGDAQRVIEGEAGDVVADLLALNGSSAGARPKALIGVSEDRQRIIHGGGEGDDKNYAPWIVKFANTQDGVDAGTIEYVYALMARQAGLEMAETHLFPAQGPCAGYFATARFDRLAGGRRLHVHSASGLLHADFRVPLLDYRDLLTLAQRLTRDMREVEKLYRLAVFNVLAHNRDDHAKNFAFLMNDAGEWRFAPVYDVTFSNGPGGEQSTMVMGEGRAPGIAQLEALAADAKIPAKRASDIIEATQQALSGWPDLAQQYGVSTDNITYIQRQMNAVRDN